MIVLVALSTHGRVDPYQDRFDVNAVLFAPLVPSKSIEAIAF